MKAGPAMTSVFEAPPAQASPVAPAPIAERARAPTGNFDSLAIGQPAVVQEPGTIVVKILETAQKGEGMGSYATYKLHTRSTHPAIRQADTIVERRFNDFVWLHQQLCATYRNHVVPPIPEKTGVTGMVGNKFSPELLEYRRRELERFLKRVVAHPALANSPDLHAFLEATDEKLSGIKLAGGIQKQKEAEAAPASGGFWSVLGSAASKVSNLSIAAPEEVDKWFEARTKCVNELEAQLNNTARAANILSRKHAELEAAAADIAGACAGVAGAEMSFDKGTEDSFSRLADIYAPMSSLLRSLAGEETNQFEEALRDYVRYIASVKEMLKYRLEVLGQLQAHSRSLKEKKEKVKTATGTTLAKLSKEIPEDEKTESQKNVLFESVSKTCRMELERFDTTKAKEIKAAIARLVQYNMNTELQIVDMWKVFLAQLQATE